MTGSLGMLASTLPVQWLLPVVGWRGLFWIVAVLLALAMTLIAWAVPRDAPARPTARTVRCSAIARSFAITTFMRLAPLGFFTYGGLVAVQSLWAGPWLTESPADSPASAARGLFAINLAMLCRILRLGHGHAAPDEPRLARSID